MLRFFGKFLNQHPQEYMQEKPIASEQSPAQKIAEMIFAFRPEIEVIKAIDTYSTKELSQEFSIISAFEQYNPKAPLLRVLLQFTANNIQAKQQYPNLEKYLTETKKVPQDAIYTWYKTLENFSHKKKNFYYPGLRALDCTPSFHVRNYLLWMHENHTTETRHMDIIKKLIDSMDIDAINQPLYSSDRSISLLHLAGSLGNEEICCYLLDKGANINITAPEIKGMTPLLYTLASPNLPNSEDNQELNNVARLLLDRGADVFAETTTGCMTLGFTQYHGKQNFLSICEARNNEEMKDWYEKNITVNIRGFC